VNAPSRPPRLRRPGRGRRVFLAIAVVVVVAVAGIGLVEYVNTVFGEPILVVYTYPSLLNGTDCGSPAFGTVFGTFASAHHVRIEVDCPSGTLIGTLESQANAPGADLVIGLDEITTPQAEARDLLLPYAPPALADVPTSLAAELSPDDGAVPYEYGYLSIDYTESFLNSTGGAVARATFPEIADNASTWAKQLVTEDPTQDITGEEFLAWQVEYYETVLHQNWTTFWTTVAPNLPPPAPDWGTAFGYEFDSAPSRDQMVVSYSTDPAYAHYYDTLDRPYNATLSWWNGTEYGWKTIYGIGIVRGSRHVALDEQFENWFLSGTVQRLLPTLEWEYPANDTIPLPSVFRTATNVSGVVPLNDRISPTALAAEMPGWSEEWQEILSP
jgi:thiamine transport system substrate-binding protein